MPEFPVKFLAIYAMVCMVLSALYIVRHFDAIRRKTAIPGHVRPESVYPVFMAGVIYLVLTSPVWVPLTAYQVVVMVIREIRKIEV